ncbi:zinc finger and BTB domain-containing protein 6-like [Hydra vulgaris]|uniref:Zinc finger and BTB domain-containing protein 6-like n=1 Tax=Hydra vulgaris TaxID=6087 RepID=A0ABM4DNA1_HYDVU
MDKRELELNQSSEVITLTKVNETIQEKSSKLLSAWNMFYMENKDNLNVQNDSNANENFGIRSKVLAQAWKQCSKLQKEHYKKLASQHKKASISCQCGKLFKKKKEFNRHQKSCGKVFECHSCSKSFGANKNLKRHVKEQHNGEARKRNNVL